MISAIPRMTTKEARGNLGFVLLDDATLAMQALTKKMHKFGLMVCCS